MFNIQSGIKRGAFLSDKGHKQEISGIVVDRLNKVIVSSGLDGKLVVLIQNITNYSSGTLRNI